MNFKVEFNLDNAAFQDYPEIEVDEILQNMGQKVLEGQVFGPIADKNGNKVGAWEFTDD